MTYKTTNNMTDKDKIIRLENRVEALSQRVDTMSALLRRFMRGQLIPVTLPDETPRSVKPKMTTSRW